MSRAKTSVGRSSVFRVQLEKLLALRELAGNDDLRLNARTRMQLLVNA